ncbi:hypothetical protein MTR67_013377 [Solanum verrucosum]|uniref:MULE transposase domain-containing protein n=1 Tax=Solanum verrucosum TaxID=315347 RepID=A0AAF0QAF5_SOLVR|nr:hypothetical protein MTR67_013377 [Solanum verrucosum]
MMILRETMGDWNMEFARLCDYAEVIKQTNHGSSVWGACKGELLVAVGKNGNNKMFPIAWAVVDNETKHSWSFFINFLKEDLQLGTRQGLTVMVFMKLLMNCYQMLKLEGVLDTSGLIGIKDGNEWKEGNKFGDVPRVKRVRETAKSSQPPPFVDTSITVIKGITSQLPPRTRQIAGQKRERVATGEDFARGGPKRPTNGGSSNVGFGIYTSASGIQILNMVKTRATTVSTLTRAIDDAPESTVGALA